MSIELVHAVASVIGSDHRRPGKFPTRNNQDAVVVCVSPDLAVAVVCDGCSSMPYSEVGARYGANFIVRKLIEFRGQLLKRGLSYADTLDGIPVLELARQSLMERLLYELTLYPMTPSSALEQHFLFTIVGCVITPDETITFSIGDGVIALNGVVRNMGPFPGNYPPYIAYGVFGSEHYSRDSEHLRFVVHDRVPTASISSLMIASDGVADWEKISGRFPAYKKDSVGPLSQFWSVPLIGVSKLVQQRWNEINKERIGRHDDNTPFIEAGLLADDTSLVVFAQPTKKE